MGALPPSRVPPVGAGLPPPRGRRGRGGCRDAKGRADDDVGGGEGGGGVWGGGVVSCVFGGMGGGRDGLGALDGPLRSHCMSTTTTTTMMIHACDAMRRTGARRATSSSCRRSRRRQRGAPPRTTRGGSRRTGRVPPRGGVGCRRRRTPGLGRIVRLSPPAMRAPSCSTRWGPTTSSSSKVGVCVCVCVAFSCWGVQVEGETHVVELSTVLSFFLSLFLSSPHCRKAPPTKCTTTDCLVDWDAHTRTNS